MDYLQPAPVTDKVSAVVLAANTAVGLTRPRGARWLVVHELTALPDPTATPPSLYVLDTGPSTASAIPAERRLVGTLPYCIDVTGWPDLGIIADGAGTARVELTETSGRRRSRARSGC